MRLTAESEIPIFQYSDGAAGGARARARERMKVLKNALTGIGGVDVLRESTCSAHISG